MPRRLSLVLFLVIVLGGGLLIGYATLPGAWYAALDKPAFNPPNRVFGPVWSLLYVLVAIAGWRIWQTRDSGRTKALWIIQLVLNFLWSPVFFGARMPAAALVVIVALLIAILAFIATAWRRDRIAAWLFVPYAAWVAFATLLNLSIARLN
jgi:tryptophan-rich sensory protein